MPQQVLSEGWGSAYLTEGDVQQPCGAIDAENLEREARDAKFDERASKLDR